MKHLGTKIINTKRLTLRPFTLDDASSMFSNWANDDEVTKYLSWPTHKDINVTISILKLWVDSYKYNNFYQWGIVNNENNELIGGISIVSIEESIDSVEIGYCISRKYWNKGITTEALQHVIEFLFDEVKVNRIHARHDVNNIASERVMQKCGLKYEGTLRDAALTSRNTICDVKVHSILKKEYKKS